MQIIINRNRVTIRYELGAAQSFAHLKAYACCYVYPKLTQIIS